MADSTLWFTMLSDSPKRARLSECPIITKLHRPASIPGATSPVNAPFSSKCMF